MADGVHWDGRWWSASGGLGPERGGAVLPGASGSPSPDGAVLVRPLLHRPELRRGPDEQGVGGGVRRARVHGRQMAPPRPEGPPRRLVGRSPVRDGRGPSGTTGWPASSSGRRIRRRPTRPIGRSAPWPGKRPFARHDPAHPECFRTAAAPVGDVQAVRRPAVRGQGAGHRRPPPVAAGPCADPSRRPEEPDTGARPNAARAADDARCSRAAGPRPQAERDDPAVRLTRHRHRLRHRKNAADATGPGSYRTS